MSHGNWRGSFAIPMTPFDERDRIDENVLAAEIEFCVASGVVWIQNAGLVPLSLDQVVRLCTEIEHVCWVKEEVSPGPQRIGMLIDRVWERIQPYLIWRK